MATVSGFQWILLKLDQQWTKRYCDDALLSGGVDADYSNVTLTCHSCAHRSPGLLFSDSDVGGKGDDDNADGDDSCYSHPLGPEHAKGPAYLFSSTLSFPKFLSTLHARPSFLF